MISNAPVMRMKYVIPFSRIRRKDVPLVGGKTASLGELLHIGMPVPDGFAVTAEAYRYFIKYNKLDAEIKGIIRGTDLKRIKELKQVGSSVRSLIHDSSFPRILEKQILQAYRSLGSRFVAVRSSATAEDLPSASFAGQQETYLNVDEKNLLKRIRDCFASLFTDRAISYREDKGFDHFRVYLSVAVEKQIFSKASGVLFTIDPDSGHRNFIVINAGFGLGDYIVQGKITPDEFWVFKKNCKLIEKKLGKKNVMEIRSIFGVKRKRVSLGMRSSFSISDKEAEQLAAYGKRIENHYGHAMDIEWAKGEDNKLYIIQARPETIHSKAKTSYDEYVLKEKGTLLAEGAAIGRKIASGRVNVIRNVRDIGRFRKGEILVTTKTDPDWEPVLKMASGVITEEGGRTCFTGDTKILTNKGFFTMEQIHSMFSQDSPICVPSLDVKTNRVVWRRILATSKKNSKVWKLQISPTLRSKQNFISTTPDHKFFTLDNRRVTKNSISKILDNEEGVLVSQRVSQWGNTPLTDKKAYILGALLSDGFHMRNKQGGYIVGFVQNLIDKKIDFIEEVCSSFKTIYGKNLKQVPDKRSSSVSFQCYSKDIYCQIVESKQEIQKLVLSMEEPLLLRFLAGYIDGDGNISRHQVQITVSENNKNLLEAIVIASYRLGIIPTVSKQKSWYVVSYSENVENLLKFTKRVKGNIVRHTSGKRFLAKQVLSDIIDDINKGGKIKHSYLGRNLLITKTKIKSHIIPLLKNPDIFDELLESDYSMQRAKLEDDLGFCDVYDLTVEASDEMDHNYLVFTSNYTPLIVSNCHAAIVSRELGIPAIVGVSGATKKLKGTVTIDCSNEKGKIWKGTLKFERRTHDIKKIPRTRTKVCVNIGEPDEAVDASLLPVDGVGLAREEFIISSAIGEHPLAMIKQKRGQIFVDELASGIAKIAAAFYPRPVIIRFSDFKTNEYRNLKGGEKYEPREENPMLGWRGASRYIGSYEPAFRLELKAIKKCVEEFGLDNIKIMIPFCRTVEEAEKTLKIIQSEKISAEVGVMAEIPSNVLLAKDFARHFKFFSVGSNDLTQLTLGIDRDNLTLAKEFDERNEAVKKLITELIKTAHSCRRPVGICGQAPSDYPDFTKFLVENKIDSISVNPDVAVSTRLLVAKAEKK